MDNFLKKINEIEEFGKTWQLDIPKVTNKKVDDPLMHIKSWQVPRKTAEFLHFMVVNLKPKIVLELGMSLGFSTCWLAYAAKDYGGEIYTVENFPQKIEVAKRNFKELKLENQITIIEKDILSVLQSFDKKADFIFLDANRNQYVEYFSYLIKLLSDSGVLIVDNAMNLPKHMVEFFKLFETEVGTTHILDFDNGLFIFKKGKIKK